jgi:hypothetical protein
MPIVPQDYDEHVRTAVAHYWQTLLRQSERQGGGRDVDRGGRAAVTGGKQMDGFCDLVSWLLRKNGMPEANIYVRSALEIPPIFSTYQNVGHARRA